MLLVEALVVVTGDVVVPVVALGIVAVIIFSFFDFFTFFFWLKKLNYFN